MGGRGGLLHHGRVLLSDLIHMVDGGVHLAEPDGLLFGRARDVVDQGVDAQDLGDDARQGLTGLTDEKIVEEIERTQRAVATITGQTPTYFRPPYGALSERVTGKLAELGLPAVLWDVDSADWQGPPAAVLVDNAVSPANQGSIILLHDIKAHTVEQVPAVLEGLRDRGFSLVTLDHLLGGTAPRPGSTVKSAR